MLNVDVVKSSSGIYKNVIFTDELSNVRIDLGLLTLEQRKQLAEVLRRTIVNLGQPLVG
jgi:hypothetical protein